MLVPKGLQDSGWGFNPRKASTQRLALKGATDFAIAEQIFGNLYEALPDLLGRTSCQLQTRKRHGIPICVSVESRAESVGAICEQTCRGCKYGLIAVERMKRVESEFERDSHVEDID
jgi:hypothetical protein